MVLLPLQPFGMEEKAHLFTSWVALVVFLTARAHEPTDNVLGWLNTVQHIA